MSALKDSEIVLSSYTHNATVITLVTDHYLESEYGHLSAHELHEQQGIDDVCKKRVVELQIAAIATLHSAGIATPLAELSSWIECQQTLTNDYSYDYV